MNRITRFFFAMLLLPASFGANSAVLDFEDLTLGDMFMVPDVFVTSGVSISVQPFTFSGGGMGSNFAQVQNGLLAGGSGKELAVNNVLLDFTFGGPIPGLGLLFGEFGGNLNLEINGDFRNFQNFADINGLTIGGVNVAALNGLGNDQGVLTLGGTINSFALGGQELWIDNVSVVPVPAAFWLFATALIGFVGISRRRLPG